MKSTKSLTISYKTIRIFAYSFLLLPILLFLLFCVRPIVSVPACILLGFVFFFANKEETDPEKSVTISLKQILLFGALCAIWCYLGGQGGQFFQTSDWNERNAIFRDLIEKSWPVIYDTTDTALTYYIGHWLPAALLGKVVFLITHHGGWAFALGNIFLGMWTFFGVMITLLLILCGAGSKSKKGHWIVFGVFIAFSGLDIIGTLIQEGGFLRYVPEHLEWWAHRYQFSSITTCLFWVFNQAVTAWIATLCFFYEKTNRSYAFIVCCSLLSSTLPCLGLAILILGRVGCQIYGAVREKNLWHYIKRTFSFVNVVSTACLLPILGTYLLSNSAFEKTVENAGSTVQPGMTIGAKIFTVFLAVLAVAILTACVYYKQKVENKKLLNAAFSCAMLLVVMVAGLIARPYTGKVYFIFLLLEFGIYWLLLLKNHYNDPMLYIIGGSLILAPQIRVGIGADFCMRASIPALILLLLMCAKKLCNWVESSPEKSNCKAEKITCWLLIACLLIGSVTPLVEVHRGISKVAQAGTIKLRADAIVTLDKYHPSGGIYGNFVSENYEETLFFKYFARRK